MFSPRQAELTSSVCAQGGVRVGKEPVLDVPKQSEPRIKNLLDGVANFASLARLLADNNKSPGTHRILVRGSNLRLMTDPGFDLMPVAKCAKTSTELNASSYKKLVQARESAKLAKKVQDVDDMGDLDIVSD